MKARTLLSTLTLLGLLSGSTYAVPMGTIFTYQGKLTSGGNAANGVYDFYFAVYDTATLGVPLAPRVATNALPVTDGCFVVNLDFGDVFAGEARWLEISVKTNGAVGWTVLAPRQQLTPTPYSLFASDSGTLGGQIPSHYAPATGSTTYVARSGDTMTGALNLPADGLVAGSSQLVLSGGNVGIGTNNLQAKLEVAGTASISGTLTIGTGGNINLASSGAGYQIGGQTVLNPV